MHLLTRVSYDMRSAFAYISFLAKLKPRPPKQRERFPYKCKKLVHSVY